LRKVFSVRTLLKNIILFLIFSPVSGFGQSNYPPCIAYDNKGKDTIRSINSHSNILYAGIDNPIELVKKNVPFKNIIVECTRGMTMEDSLNYIVMPSKPGTTLISIYQFDKGDTVLYFQKAMQVKSLPQPYITLEMVKLTELEFLSKQLLLKNRHFEVHLSEDFVDDSQWFTVKEITIGYPFGKLYVTKSCESNTLSDDILKAINKLPQGTEVTFIFTISGEGDLFKRMGPIRMKVR